MRNRLYLRNAMLTALILYSISVAHSQDIPLADSDGPVDAFRSSQLINAQTTTMPAKGGFEFHIRHRFGAIGLDRTIITNFLGTDVNANIHFGFIFSAGNKMYVGCGRTKNGKTYDVELKRLLLGQTEDNKIPVSVAAYIEGSIMSDNFSPVPKYAFYENGTTPFSYKFNHRLAYNSQLIISRKFSEKISLQVAPVFIYQNLVSPGRSSYTRALPVSGIIRTGLSSSILFEYAFRFNNRQPGMLNPVSVAYEIATVSHVFQIVVSSTNELLEQAIYTTDPHNYLKGEYLLGFNIKRIFWYKKKNLQ